MATAAPPTVKRQRSSNYGPAVAAAMATQQGHLGFLSAMNRSLATGADSTDPIERYAGFSASDFERAKEVQDRLAESGRGTTYRREAGGKYIDDDGENPEQERTANSEFIANFRERLKAKGSFVAGTKVPGGYEWADGASELAGAQTSGSNRIWVDPERIGAESIRYEKTGEEATRTVLLCEWVDPLASKLVKGRTETIGNLPPAETDPFAIAMGLAASPFDSGTTYQVDAVKHLKDQVVRLGHNRTDEYLKRFYKPTIDYRKEEWVSPETENRFRAWMSSEKNNRDQEGWKKLILAQLPCSYHDTVHVLRDCLETLVFRQRNQVFLNVILERVATPDIRYRIVGHYYTYSLQLLAKFSEPEK